MAAWDVDLGDVFITEMQVNPKSVADKNGEYIEVYNNSSQAISLYGFRIEDDAPNKRRINTDLILLPNDYAVFAPTTQTNVNGSVPADWGWGIEELYLDNTGDIIVLNNGHANIDVVNYTGSWPFANGRAMELKSNGYSMSGNNNSSNWCQATAYYSSNNRGTPSNSPSCN